MNHILKYLFFLVIIFITSFSSNARGESNNYKYSNHDYFVLPSTNINNKTSEKKRASYTYYKNDTIKSGTKSNTGIKLNVIDDPTVDFEFTNDNSCSGTDIQFKPKNVTGGTKPYKYKWDFGDGHTSTDKDPIHSFNSLGCSTESFSVKLTVTDADDKSASKEKTITVKQKPDISFSDVDNPSYPFDNCDKPTIEDPNYSITVGNTSPSKSCVESYSIDWGDDTSIEKDITFPINHEYTKMGAFEMVFTAKGENGCENDILYIVKNQTNPSGGLNSPGTTANLCAPTDALGFTITGSAWGINSPGTIYKVNYGDGSINTFFQDDMVKTSYYNSADPSSSDDFPIPHSYTLSSCQLGETSYTVILDVINACDETQFTASNIKILTKPIPDFKLSSQTCVNTEILFENTTKPGYGGGCRQEADYTWDFGDGSVIVAQKNTLPKDITHTYTASGVYNVTLTAINYYKPCGGDSITKQVTISKAPTATITGGAEVCIGDTPPTITFTGADNNPPYIFTYRINNGSNRTVKTEAGNSIITINAPTNKAGTFTYTLVSVSASGCSQSQTGTVVIIVNSAPTATIKGDIETCLNETEPFITFTGANGTAPYTFTYNINGGSNKTITTTTGNSVSVKAPTNAEGEFKYNLLGVKDVSANSCSVSQTGTATVKINDKPPPPNSLSDLEYCNGETTSTISFSNNVPGTTFEWTNSNTDIGLSSSGSGNIQPFKAKNSTINSISSIITVVAINNGCRSDSKTFTITVLPSASVDFSEADQTICSGETTTKVVLSSTTPGAVLSWTTEQPSGIQETIKLTGTNVIESQTLTNITNTPISILYKAKATLSGSTQCSGIEYNYTITVNPKPIITHDYTDTICSGTAFNISPEDGGGNVVPAGTKYTWDEPVINPSGSLTGGSRQDIPQLAISQTLVNTTSVIATATYTVTPIADNCPTDPFEIIISVIPGAVIDPIDNIVLCSDDLNPEIDLGKPPDGTRYKWSTDNPDIGLTVSSGYDAIPEFTANNNGTSPIIANFKIESETVGDSDCKAVPVLFKITVNPKPKILGNKKDTICSGNSFSLSPKHGVGGDVVPTGTKYTWNTPVIIPSGSITGAIEQTTPQSVISQTLVNTSDVIATVTYTIIPTTNSCTGASFELTVSVVPGASLVPVSDIALCNGEVNEEIDFGEPPEGVVFEWEADNMDIGLPDITGNGNIPEFTAVNNGTFPITAKIIVTPKGDFGTSDCDGNPIQFSITVNPTAQVDNPGNYIECSGNNISILFNTQNTGGTTIFEWTNSNTNIGLGASGKGDTIIFDAMNTGDAPIIATISVTPLFANNGDTCIGITEQFTITVNPIPTVDQPEDQSVCNGSNTEEIIFSGKVPGTIFNWSINDTTIGFPASGTGDIPETVVENNLSDSIVAIITVIPTFNNCTGIPIEIKIVVHPSAIILKQPSSSTICLGEKPVTLSVIHTTGVKQPTYQWYSNTTNSIIGGTLIENETDYKYDPPYSYTNTMFYYCLITFSKGGCGNLATDIAKVAINPNPIIILNDEQISEGEELKFCEGDTIYVKAKGADKYIWNAGTAEDSISIWNIGDYRVIGITKVGCKDTFNFSASYFDLMYYAIESDKNELTNDQNELHLWSKDILNSYYSWDFGDGETGSGYDVTHVYDITQDGYFDVDLKIINPFGCAEYATKRIWTSLETTPNTFTPNGDGINDYYLDGWYKKIYNRNGILLYEGKDGWDGTYNGRDVANDTYFVIIYDSSEVGTKYKTDYVTVLR